MGKRNRERRAAKLRARQRQDTGRRGPVDPHADGQSDTAPIGTERVARAFTEAAVAYLGGDASVPESCAELVTGARFSTEADQRTVDAAASLALQRTVGDLWRRGWLPYDVWQLVHRELSPLAGTLVVDTIAAQAQQYAPATVHERWHGQLSELNATLWWEQDEPQLSQWAHRHQQSRFIAAELVVTLLALLMSMPELPRVLPPPGTASRGAHPARGAVDQKVLARVRGLLAKAESTQFPEEAEALSAKAQELMNRHAFERAMVDADDHVPQSATSRRLWLDNPYLAAKAQLVDVVGTANRCRAVFYQKFGFVQLIGDELDLEITELLATSLLVQATKAMMVAGKGAGRAGGSTSRSFRQSFLLAYAVRIGERLEPVTAVSEDAVADARLLPVLAARTKAVDDLFERLFPHTTQRSYSIKDAAGWGAGRAAADLAELGVDRTVIAGA